MTKSKKVSTSQENIESVHKWPRKIELLNDATKQEILKDVEQAIEETSTSGMNCAERTFAPICQAFEKWSGLPREVIRISSGFGGGGGNMAYGLCGAVSGGLMGLGIFWGRVDPIDYFRAAGMNSVTEAMENPLRRDEFCRIFNHYMKEFESSFGSLICRDLIKDYLDSRGFYLPDPKLQEERKPLCKNFSTWSALRVAQLILEG